MKWLPTLAIFLLALSSPLMAQDQGERELWPVEYEGVFEFTVGIWNTDDADEGFMLGFAARMPVTDRFEIVWGVEMGLGVGNDLMSSDPLDCVDPGDCDFDVNIYGTYFTILYSPSNERVPGDFRISVGGGAGIYLAEFVDESSYWHDHRVDSDVAPGVHAIVELEWVYSEGGWFKLQIRHIWVDFDAATFTLPSGLSDVDDFSGLQVLFGWGIFI